MSSKLTDLTESQKNSLEWIVRSVESGDLPDEEILFAWAGDNETNIAGYGGDIPAISQTALQALNEAGLIHLRSSGPNSWLVTPRPSALKAVASGFAEEERGSVIPGARVTVYNLHGNNSRINIDSTDASVNVVSVAPDQLFTDLRRAIQSLDMASRVDLMQAADRMEKEIGKKSYAAKYAEFMALAANHATVLMPFFPALSQLLPA